MDKHNIKHCKDPYNIISNNCAKNVAQILKKVGVKDIDFFGPDVLRVSYPTPENNPFGIGMKGWCLKHGVPAKIEEVALDYKHHEIRDLDKREEWFDTVRKRYNHFKDYLTSAKTQSKLSER